MEKFPEKEPDYNQIDKSDQYTIEDQMTYKDAKKRLGFFKSLKSRSTFSNVVGLFGIAFVLVGAITAGMALQDKDVSTDETSAASECGDFQVKVLTQDGYYCKDCEAGEYGQLDMCESDSSSGKCKKADSGCFEPDI
jgi:hypothetical protein